MSLTAAIVESLETGKPLRWPFVIQSRRDWWGVTKDDVLIHGFCHCDLRWNGATDETEGDTTYVRTDPYAWVRAAALADKLNAEFHAAHPTAIEDYLESKNGEEASEAKASGSEEI